MSISFNGTDSILSGGNTTFGSTVTCCFWCYITGAGEGNAGHLVVLGNDSFVIRTTSTSDQLRIEADWLTTNGVWTIPCTWNQWNAVGISYDFGSLTNDPIARVNFASATVTEVSAPVGAAQTPNTAYAIGNRTPQNNTYAGRLANVQIFGGILSASQMDACLYRQGIVRPNLFLWLPMFTASWIKDYSVRANHPSSTASLSTAAGPPCQTPWFGDCCISRGAAAAPSTVIQDIIGRGVVVFPR